MVAENEDAQDDWPRYAITILSRAKTYKEGMSRLDRLNTEAYAYTTGSEPEEKSKQTTESIMEQARRDKSKLGILMEVPELTEVIKTSNLDNNANYESSEGNPSASDRSTDGTESSYEQRVAPKSSKKSHESGPGSKKCSTSAIVGRQGEAPVTVSNRINKTSSKTTDVEVPVISNDAVLPKSSPSSSTVAKLTMHKTSATTSMKKQLTLFDNDTATNGNDVGEQEIPAPIILATQESPSEVSKSSSVLTEGPKSSHRASTNTSLTKNLPVVTSHTVSYDFQLLVKELRTLSYEHRQLTGAVNTMKTTLDNVLTTEALVPKAECFESSYELNIPFKTQEEFLEFDEKLSSNEQFRSAFVNALSRKFDEQKSATKNITAALKKYLTREVALLYNAQKSIKGKYLFKKTRFSGCLLDTIDIKAENGLIAPISDEAYLVLLGAVLSNIKDWGIHRNDRPCKRPRAALVD